MFKAFVRDHIPHYISLGDVAGLRRLEAFGGLYQLPHAVVEGAVQRAISVLKDHALEAEWVSANFASLKAFCGIDTVCEQYVGLYERGLTQLP